MSFVSSMLATAAAAAAEEKALRLFTPHVQSIVANIVKRNMVHQSKDVSGWDFERKMSALLDLQDVLEAPCFNYRDWGDLLPSKRKGLNLLSLQQGQDALLDLWAFFLEFCDVVPARSGARALLLRLAGCMCRRLEFIPHAVLNNVPLELSATGKQRYLALLQSSMQLCANKLGKSRILTQDHAYFASHVFTAAFYRFPKHIGQPILKTIAQYAIKLEAIPGHKKETTPVKWPDNFDTLWTCYDDDSVLSEADRIASTCASYQEYQTVDRNQSQSPPSVQTSSMATLQAALLHNILRSSIDEELAFIRECPHLYNAQAEEIQLWHDSPIESTIIEAAVVPFLERLEVPTRDSILCVVFLSTFIEDSIVMMSKLTDRIMWQCIPGYPVILHTFVQVFRKVCARRKPPPTFPLPSPPRGQSQQDPWAAYWATNELEPVYDGLSDLLANGVLLNVFVQIILESTNMYDPQSVDYAFNILQQILESAAYATTDSSQQARGVLPQSFDMNYYLQALRKALASSHFQILLKVLAFIYATAGKSMFHLLESKRRRQLVSEVLLHEHFFVLFLHWNEEVRRMFAHLLVYKLFTSHRFDLPLVSDRVLLANSPFFRPSNAPTQSWLTQLLSPPKGTITPPPDHGGALERLMIWDTSATLKQARERKQDKLFRDSLLDEELMLDLSMTSKLDALLKMIAEQVQNPSDASYYPQHLQVYAKKAVSQYVGLLWGYYQAAFDEPSQVPEAPELEFTVQNFFADVLRHIQLEHQMKPSAINTDVPPTQGERLSPTQRAAAALGEAANFIRAGASEITEATIGAIKSGNIVGEDDHSVDMPGSPSLLEMGKGVWRHLSKFKRESTGATEDDDDDDGNEYYSDEEEVEWEEILEKPIQVILTEYRDKPWHEAPARFLRKMNVQDMFLLPIAWQTKVFILFTGPFVTFLTVAGEWAMAGAVFFTYFLLVGFGSMIYFSALLSGTLAMAEKLPWRAKLQFEYKAYRMFLHLEVEEALQYRVRAPRILELVASGDASKEVRERKKKLMSTLVSTEIDGVRANIDGSMKYTDQCAKISFGSVIVAALLYVLAASDQFIRTGLDFTIMNTKTFDALAIILPYLLNEELSVMLSRITLVISWFAIFRHENPVVRYFEKTFMAGDEKDDSNRTEFVNDAEKMCKNIGVGAIDMSSAASLLTAVWTINFLFQSYYVDTKGSGGEPGPKGLADTMFWGMVFYSLVLITLSYLPFSSWVGGLPAKDEKYQAMLASCQSFLLMDRLSVLQRQISDAVRLEKKSRAGNSTKRLVSSDEKRLVKQLRGELIKHLDKQTFVSYVLYSISLGVISLGASEHDDKINQNTVNKIRRLRTRAKYTWCSKLLIPIEKFEEAEVEMDQIINESEKARAQEDEEERDEEAMRQGEAGGLIGNDNEGDIISTFYEFQVLDCQVQHAFMDKGVTDLSTLIDNPLVRDSQVYWNHARNQVVLGVELKVMERSSAKSVHDRTVFASIYFVAINVKTDGYDRFEIGNGGLYIKSDILERAEVRLEDSDVVYQKVPGRARSRFMNRCFLARTDLHESSYHPEVVFNGALPGKGTYVRRRNSVGESQSRTGSASHLSGDRYNSARVSTAVKLFSTDDRTGSQKSDAPRSTSRTNSGVVKVNNDRTATATSIAGADSRNSSVRSLPAQNQS